MLGWAVSVVLQPDEDKLVLVVGFDSRREIPSLVTVPAVLTAFPHVFLDNNILFAVLQRASSDDEDNVHL